MRSSKKQVCFDRSGVVKGCIYHVVIVVFVDMIAYGPVLSFVMENDPEFIILYLLCS